MRGGIGSGQSLFRIGGLQWLYPLTACLQPGFFLDINCMRAGLIKKKAVATLSIATAKDSVVSTDLI